MHYRRLVLPDHLTRLSDCIKPITSPSFEWITFLTLAHVSCTRTELIQVSRVANLGMLTIGPLLGEETELDNSLVRAWSRAASEAGAFGKLRILVFNDVSYPAITSSVFTYFREFPALAMFLFPLELRSIEFDEDSIANGWFRFRGRKLRSSRLEAQSSVWQDVYRDCFNGDGSVDVCKLETQCNLAHNTTSILDLVCGKSSNNQYSKPTIWNCYGQQTLQTYFRKNGWRDRILRIRKDDDKRAGLTSSDTNRSPPKKRAMRSVKHQHMGALLADFNM
ncbi:MAG: hypothetical protein LQ352_000231 [Teloschistes flavicans]|nr:MAG: hypothetical protein LQ352_000231 [Teloschistes flavicans]